MIELAALDIAGTTVDDGGRVYESLQQSVEETGASVAPSDLQKWMGAAKPQAIAKLMELGGKNPDPQAVERQFLRFREILTTGYADNPPRPFPGVVEALAGLRAAGVRVALTTGFDRDVALPLLESLGWSVGDGESDVLDAVVTVDEVPAGRPAPYMIFRAMERTGVTDVRRVVAAGDTAVDLLAGHNAGAVAVGVLTGKAPRELLEAQPHDAIIPGVAQLPEFVKSLG